MKKKAKAKPQRVKAVRVRRFEMGASSLLFFDFLDRCGYKVHHLSGAYYNLKRKGDLKYKRVRTGKLMELVDDLRIKKGLEPLKKRDTKK